MSSHRRSTQYFSRKFNARKALFRGLMNSLVEHERIQTTVEKAKELRRHIEKAITLGKRENLTARRLLLSRIANDGTVSKIMSDLSPRFKSRPGGYTRIIKIGRRPGDTAEMAFIEFVDYDFKKAAKPKAKSGKAGEADAKKELKAQAKESKRLERLDSAKKKSVRKMRAHSRAANRG